MINNEIERMPKNYRRVFEMYYLESISTEEIAAALDISPSNVRLLKIVNSLDHLYINLDCINRRFISDQLASPALTTATQLMQYLTETSLKSNK